MHDDRKTDEAEARRRKREEEEYRAHLAPWKRFMDSERRELELRKGGGSKGCWANPSLGSRPRRWSDSSKRTGDRCKTGW